MFSLSNDSPVIVKIFVAILVIAAVPTYVQAQSRSTPKVTKGDDVIREILDNQPSDLLSVPRPMSWKVTWRVTRQANRERNFALVLFYDQSVP
jgi:hypothetical protein